MYVIFWYIITKCTEFVVVIMIISLFYLSVNMHCNIKQFSVANSNWPVAYNLHIWAINAQG